MRLSNLIPGAKHQLGYDAVLFEFGVAFTVE